MRAKDIVKEDSIFADSLLDKLENKGYKDIGGGVDQIAFLSPDGSILKVFGSHGSRKGSFKLTRSQLIFKAFADYCNANSNNPFLPQFSSWKSIVYEDHPYLLIKTERLFHFPNVEHWGVMLEMIADKAIRSNSPEVKEAFIDFHLNQQIITPNQKAQEVFTHLGEEGFNLLWDTIHDLSNLAYKIGADIDLHKNNFMVTHEGQIVINDPFNIDEDA